MQSKNALSNLKSRYIAVLKKCNLLNTFGTLAIAALCVSAMSLNPHIAHAADNPQGETVDSMDATDGGNQVPLNQVPALNSPILNNYGNIMGGVTYQFDGRTNKIGMFGGHTSGNIDYIFTNYGTINIDFFAGSFGFTAGMYAYGDGNHTLANSGTITAITTDLANTGSPITSLNYRYSAFGMYAYTNGIYKKTLTNSGTIVATAVGGTIINSINVNAAPSAVGMYADGDGNHTLTNSGSITATARGGEATSTGQSASASAFAYGMYAYGSGNHTLTNSGSIAVNATGGMATSTSGNASDSAFAFARAHGMYAFGNGNHTLTNSGTITVNATGGMATTTAGTALASALAYGMLVQGTPTAGTFHLLTNTGIINASASVQAAGESAQAYEAYGAHSFTVDTWATTLRTWSANDAVFGLDRGDIITFANGTAGASLIVRPDTAERGFVLDKAYNVANMVAIYDGTNMAQQDQFATGFIEGSIANVTTEVDFLTATLHNGGTNNPSVSLSLNTDALPTTTITTADLNAKLAHMKGVDDVSKNAVANVYNRAFDLQEIEEVAQVENTGIAAGSNTLSSMPKWTVFATPYGSYTDNSEYDYDSGTYGISGGLTHNFSEKFALGGHIDFNASNTDDGKLESDSYSFALGAHSHYFVNPNWYVRANATFAIGNNEVEYKINSAKAEDTFSTFALFAGLHTGYAFEINKNNLIIPEIGLSYLYSQNSAYDLHFSKGYSMYDMDYDTHSYSNLYADFNLTWQGNFAVGNSVLSPSLGAGIRQNLTGSDIDSSYDMFGTSFETVVSSDDTVFLANAGLEWTHKNFSVSVDYKGEFGNEQQSHTGSLNFTYRF